MSEEIKTALRFHLTADRMVKINKRTTTHAGEDVECEEHSLHSCILTHPLWKSVWWLLSKLGIDLPQNPAILLVDIPKGCFMSATEVLVKTLLLYL